MDQKAEELRKCKDYDYTEEEINAMVAEKKKLGLTKGRAAADKATLAMDLLAAREGDDALSNVSGYERRRRGGAAARSDASGRGGVDSLD